VELRLGRRVADLARGGDESPARTLDAADDLALDVEIAEQAVEPLGNDDGRLAALDRFDGRLQLRTVVERCSPGRGAHAAVAVDVLVPDVTGDEPESVALRLPEHRAGLHLRRVTRVVVALADADNSDRSLHYCILHPRCRPWDRSRGPRGGRAGRRA